VTLVIYMGVAHATQIRARLLAAGAASTTPVAVVANATRPDECATTGTLGGLADLMRAPGIASPAIIVVGDVVRCSVAAAFPRRDDVARNVAAATA